ncbi:MAG: hypothetical protein D9V47_00465 [Clostridia bacterium]|nr:MAG: hypothetical protein D9V47_00465 [Clostridia bacterium]
MRTFLRYLLIKVAVAALVYLVIQLFIFNHALDQAAFTELAVFALIFGLVSTVLHRLLPRR